jgi:hypothetical protein
MTARIHEELKKLDIPYAELESFTGLKPLIVTQLPRNTFQLYKQRQKALGADALQQSSPPHINPADETVEFLIAPTITVPAVVSEQMVTA